MAQGEVVVSPIAALTRVNMELDGGSETSQFATGFGLQPDGVVATCWHSVRGFYERWTPIDLDEVMRQGKPPDFDTERHETLYVMFMAEMGPPGELQTIPAYSFVGDIGLDIALIELGGRGKYRPLPYYRPCRRPLAIGQTLAYLGVRHGPGVPKDRYGQSAGFSIPHHSAKVVHITESHVYMDAVFDAGNSGCPVLNTATGGVVAMAVEVLPPELSEQATGVRAKLSRAVRIDAILRLYPRLYREGKKREASGGVPWCSLPLERQTADTWGW